MPVSDLIIDPHKLSTKFFSNHVQHTILQSDAALGMRRVKVVKKWYMGRELGRGNFGSVRLETSERGEVRAVKGVPKNSRVDYKRELMAMAMLTEHKDLFVKFSGWFENRNYVFIAMEYFSHGHLGNYLETERSEKEAKVITRQLLEGLIIMHGYELVHRDLKPENIFLVSTSPVWVKIGDFGATKQMREDTILVTQLFSNGYGAPEVMGLIGETSSYTNSVDIWSLGCVTHKMLTQVTPFPDFRTLNNYCSELTGFPGAVLASKNISQKGTEFVKRMLALDPGSRMVAGEAIHSDWLQPESDEEAVSDRT